MAFLAPTDRILVCENPGHAPEHETTWEEFIEANRDGLDAFELSLIASTVEVEGIYRGGGGAEGEWSVRKVAPTARVSH